MKAFPTFLSTLLLLSSTVTQAVELIPGLLWDEHTPSLLADLTRLFSNAEDFKVMWWNIQYCHEDNRWHQRNGSRPLKKNLEALLESALKPDLLILGEFSPEKCSQQIKELLEAVYPHVQFTPYNPRHPELGIQVYSRKAFSSPAPVALDWTPFQPNTREARAAYRREWSPLDNEEVDLFERNYRPLNFSFGRSKLSVIPFHFVEPWVLYKEEHGRFQTFYEMAYGLESPLAYQMIRFRAQLKRDHGQNFEQEAFLAIGDSNIPRTIDLTDEGDADRDFQVPSALYRRFTRGLTEVFEIRDSRPAALVNMPWTFPALSCSKRQDFPFTQWLPKIDHAVLSPGARPMYRARGVLPLRGSDHYPVYTILHPQQ